MPAIDYFFVAILHDPAESYTGPGGAPLRQITRNGAAVVQLQGQSPDNLAAALWNGISEIIPI